MARTINIFILAVVAAPFCSAVALAQQPTDSSAQSSPITPPASAPAVDAAAQARPIVEPKAAGAHTAGALASNTALAVRVTSDIDSAHLHNGQSLHFVLNKSVRTTAGRSIPENTPVTVTVVATLPAGKIASAGELSLQVLRVGPLSVNTDVQTLRGQQGHKDVADSAPDKGTDAKLAAGATLTFHVQPDPTMASGPPERLPVTPGSVDATANGQVTPR